MLHEFGHFITAKWAGMKVTEYFVGSAPGCGRCGAGRPSTASRPSLPAVMSGSRGLRCPKRWPRRMSRGLSQRPFRQRMIVGSAGSAMHFLMAFVLASVLRPHLREGDGHVQRGRPRALARARPTPAAMAGLGSATPRLGRTASNFSSPTSMTDAIKDSAGTPVALGVEHDGKLHPPDGDARERPGHHGGPRKPANPGRTSGVDIEDGHPRQPARGGAAAVDSHVALTTGGARHRATCSRPAGYLGLTTR